MKPDTEETQQPDWEAIASLATRPNDFFDGDPFANQAEILRRLLELRASGAADSALWRELWEKAEWWLRYHAVLLALHGDRQSDDSDLWIRAVAGDDDALFELLTVFKGLAGAKWVYYRVRSAAEREDTTFLMSYGKALAKPRQVHGHTNVKLVEYLVWNWPSLSELSTTNLIYKLRRAGVQEGMGTPTRRKQNGMDQYLKRLKLPRRHNTMT